MNALSSIKSALVSLSSAKNDHEADEVVVTRYAPESLNVLCERTNYKAKEIQIIYRAFKQECPTGIVYEHQFKELYAQYFPLGDGRPFAGLIFGNLDQAHNGWVTFEQFLVSMSVLTRGCVDDKLRWIFNLYDLNGDGYIVPEELLSVVTAVHSLLGPHTEPALRENTIRNHMQRLFIKMDLNGDGKISADEFTQSCLQDPKMQRSLCGLFDSSF